MEQIIAVTAACVGLGAVCRVQRVIVHSERVFVLKNPRVSLVLFNRFTTHSDSYGHF